MKITKVISIPDQEIEVSITTDEIREALKTSTDGPQTVLRGINSIAQFMKAVPDEILAGFNAGQRAIIFNFFQEQANRIHKV